MTNVKVNRSSLWTTLLRVGLAAIVISVLASVINFEHLFFLVRDASLPLLVLAIGVTWALFLMMTYRC